MSSQTTPRTPPVVLPVELPVVVGVALDGSTAAVDVAAHQAVALDAPLLLVHVLDVPAVDAYAGSYGPVLMEVSEILHEAAARARLVTGDRVQVTTERVDSGGLGPQLTALADQARLVVLQHRHLSRAHRLVSGSTVTGLAARTRTPVLSVPEGWSPDDRAPVVAVGVQDVDEAGPLLRLALDEAACRDASLVVVHACGRKAGPGRADLDETVREDGLARARTALEAVLEPLRATCPGTYVTVDVRRAPAAETLLDVTGEASLLVMGRRHHRLPLGSHLGPTVRTVLHLSPCPVLLAPEGRTPEVRTQEHHRSPAPDFAAVLY